MKKLNLSEPKKCTKWNNSRDSIKFDSRFRKVYTDATRTQLIISPNTLTITNNTEQKNVEEKNDHQGSLTVIYDTSSCDLVDLCGRDLKNQATYCSLYPYKSTLKTSDD